MDKVSVMESEMRLHVENSRGVEEGGRLDCGDLPRSSLTDTNLLHCQDATEDSSPFKYRRYGYAFLFLSEPDILVLWHDEQLKEKVSLSPLYCSCT